MQELHKQRSEADKSIMTDKRCLTAVISNLQGFKTLSRAHFWLTDKLSSLDGLAPRIIYDRGDFKEPYLPSSLRMRVVIWQWWSELHTTSASGYKNFFFVRNVCGIFYFSRTFSHLIFFFSRTFTPARLSSIQSPLSTLPQATPLQAAVVPS